MTPEVPVSETSQKPRTNIVRVVAASMAGTTVEWYDFFLYGVAAALVFPHVFFPTGNATAATLASLGTFAVGFLARPVGGLVFGHYGDRIGRKGALVAASVDRPGDLRRRLRPDLRPSRHLGRRHPDHHPLHPGSGRRRRMGRLGTVVDGMGADECPSRFYHVVSAALRSGRGAAGKHRGAGV
jgi:hypothetical protein